MMGRAIRLLAEKPSGGIELQSDAGQALFQGVMKFLGQPRALLESCFELNLPLLACAHLKLQLLGPFLNPPLQQVVRFL